MNRRLNFLARIIYIYSFFTLKKQTRQYEYVEGLITW